MIKHMEKELTLMQMEHIIMVTGLMISNMDMVWRVGLMVPNMKDNIEMVKKMEKEN